MAVSRASPACDRSVAVTRRVPSIFRSQAITHAGGGLHRASAREHGGAKPPPPPPRRVGDAVLPPTRIVGATVEFAPLASALPLVLTLVFRDHGAPEHVRASRPRERTIPQQRPFPPPPRNIVRPFFPSRVWAPSLGNPWDAGRKIPRLGGAHVGAVENLSRSGGKLPALTEKNAATSWRPEARCAPVGSTRKRRSSRTGAR